MIWHGKWCVVGCFMEIQGLAKKEAIINFLTPLCDVKSILGAADVLVYSWNWNGGKHTCVDFTGFEC